jgi:hypothetical protein
MYECILAMCVLPCYQSVLVSMSLHRWQLCVRKLRLLIWGGNVKMFSVTAVEWRKVSVKFSDRYRKCLSLLKSVWKKVIQISTLWCTLVPEAHMVARLLSGWCGVLLPVKLIHFSHPQYVRTGSGFLPVSHSKGSGALSPGIKRSCGLRYTAFTAVFKTRNVKTGLSKHFPY